ncbi:histidine phosphotransferase family protein [Celeribacter litoreus]|uniref:histidine phosphotransferase family protein n=1 Tax=Celeribacter litoreus TaxID=2876714 RepID=UPI001CCF240A|nr:histidine phosphotransferase family protein [Celeribacter litoreus]MCA0043903.1 histidine phosphotransferase [Celeribacter litoreus]
MPHDLTRDVAAMIGSRICHDLISPVGAISNGLELLTMSGITAGPELSLISESVENANARVKFFRIAFGSASEGQKVSAAMMMDILKGISTTRLTYDWTTEGDVEREEAKLACLLIMCVETALPRGGEIKVQYDQGQWQIRATGPRLTPAPELLARLGAVSGPEGIKSSEIQFILAPLQAEALLKQIKCTSHDEFIALTA